MNTLINSILQNIAPITLDEMKNIRLMDRVDSKFVAPTALLPRLLEEMTPYFRVQIVDGKAIASYATQYLDTPGLDMFTMHQNGKLNRQKIRIRSYMDSHLSFLEVKNKNNKGRTKKIRTHLDTTHIGSIDELAAERSFLEDYSLFDCRLLEPALDNSFNRITLVNNRGTERITIDTDLSFRNYRTGKEKALNSLAVLELKQDGRQYSDFRAMLEKRGIKQMSFSKYCMGTALTNPNAKYNRFKRKWGAINKIVVNG
ncbi:MAG: polyphosphate polymerase domain-containing protein [Prevotella sp.]|jgi:ASC-1-like (ASCH) protein|nr:polyphosphate polymerase domain-containing protein [Prevotella sp.]